MEIVSSYSITRFFYILLVSMKFNYYVLSWSNSSSSVPTASIHLCPPGQSLALTQFKNTFIVDSLPPLYCLDSYYKTENWKEGVDCCEWGGVTCDKFTGDVVGLDLSCCNLVGEFHSNNSLFNLPSLKSLNLAFNDFRNSPIPSDFGRLAASLTHLNLSHSRFSGSVPSEISHLSKLVLLDMSDSCKLLQLGTDSLASLLHNLTELSDLVLDNVDMLLVNLDYLANASSSLQLLSLKSCWLHGNLSESVFRLPNLKQLYLRSNFQLSGILPQFNWTGPLRILDLSHSGFSGNLPASIGNLKSLVSLDFTFCNFQGSLPASVGNLTKMISLVLHLNNFTGQIPSSLSNIESVVQLDLGSNDLSGEIPDIFHNLSSLSELAITGNHHLSGGIPSSLFSLKQLSRLYLYNNKLSGPVHYDQNNGLLTLTDIRLSGNLLSGTIPPGLFALPSLTILDLSYNQFNGPLPELLSPSLVIIKLGKNMIQGPITSSIFQLQNVTSIDLSSNNLSGTLDLDLFSKLGNLIELHLSHNSLSVEVNLRENSSTWPMLQYLDLSSCNIRSFPKFLSSQSNLVTLFLSHNKIHGEIPQWLWLLGNESLAFLDLSHNFLTSMAPYPVQPISIRYLDLSFNSIIGSISLLMNLLDISPHFSHCLLSSNKFTGEIPPAICNFSSLFIIDLSNNSLSGEIPQCLVNIRYLSVLNLRMNDIGGFIPQMSGVKYLRNLDLNGNQVEGSLPRSLQDCKKLEVLDLGNNKIIGSFPHWLQFLPELQVLILRGNRFHGPLANLSSISPFPKLRILDLSSSNFTGPLLGKYFKSLKAMINMNREMIKEKYMGNKTYRDSMVLTIKGQEIMFERILTIFATMDLSSNRFDGQIPDDVGTLQSLVGLNFSRNYLSGSIPSSLANMTALESLDLSSNKLSGEIPRQLADLKFLSALNFSNNQLTGPIPQGKQFDTFTNDSYLVNSGLCGPPLSSQCGNFEAASQWQPTVQGEDGSDSLKLEWKIAMMGYGSGLAIGFSIAYLVFMLGEPLWFARIVDRLANPYYKKLKRQRGRQQE